MNKTFCALAGAMAFATSAHADIYTFQYTGKVSKIEHQAGWGNSSALESVTLPVGSANVSDTVTGIFSWDTSTFAVPQPTESGVYAGYNPGDASVTSTMRFGDGTLVVGGAASSGVAWVYDNDAYDGDMLRLFTYHYSAARQTLGLVLKDASGSVLSGHALPGQETTQFPTGTFIYDYAFYQPDGLHSWTIEGDVTSISLVSVSAVPEPGTYAMLLAGLGLLAWRRRKAA